jgi:stringent starvation protein B
MAHPVQSVVESLYAAGRCPRLHVNAMADGVVCPDFIREQWQERLIIDLDSSYPLDLSFDDEGIGADLSFGGYVTRCAFPWKSIYVVADRATGRGIVLDPHMPESVRKTRQAQTTGPLAADGSVDPVESNEADEAVLRATADAVAAFDDPNPAESSESSPVPSPEDESVKRRRAAFRVIDGGG